MFRLPSVQDVEQSQPDEERQPMHPGHGTLRVGGSGDAPQVQRLKSNAGLRYMRQPGFLVGGSVVALVLVIVALVSAVKAGSSGGSPQRRAEVVVGHPPEHTRTQAPSPAPGSKRAANIGNVLDPLLVSQPDSEAAPAAAQPAAPAKVAIGHPPEHTQTLPPAASPGGEEVAQP